MARMGLDKLAPELIELLVKNAFDTDKEHMERSYDVPTTIKFHTSLEKVSQLERFQVWRDLLNLTATCKYLRRVVAPLVYYHDIKNNYASLLLISAKRNNLAGIAMDLNKPVQEVAAYIRHGLWGVDGSICYKTIEQGANPLYFALLAGNIEMSEFLINAGSSMNTHLGTDTTALHQACQRGNIELVRLVLDHVSPSIEDAMGNTPVHYLLDDAPDRGSIIDLLLAKGGDAFAIGLEHEEVDYDQLLHVFQRNRRVNIWFHTRFYGEEPRDDLLVRNDGQWGTFWKLETENMTVAPLILCGGIVVEDEDEELAEEEDDAHFEKVDREWDEETD
ncbi:hypothetical protein LRP88_12134 [Fusarium phalaenopsidis]